jgi:hypothetical protein
MSESTFTTTDYVRAALSGDALKAKEIFNQLMAPKVVDAVDTTRHEVAQNYFGQRPEIETAVQADDDQDTQQDGKAEITDGEQDTETEEEDTANENT